MLNTDRVWWEWDIATGTRKSCEDRKEGHRNSSGRVVLTQLAILGRSREIMSLKKTRFGHTVSYTRMDGLVNLGCLHKRATTLLIAIAELLLDKLSIIQQHGILS